MKSAHNTFYCAWHGTPFGRSTTKAGLINPSIQYTDTVYYMIYSYMPQKSQKSQKPTCWPSDLRQPTINHSPNHHKWVVKIIAKGLVYDCFNHMMLNKFEIHTSILIGFSLINHPFLGGPHLAAVFCDFAGKTSRPQVLAPAPSSAANSIRCPSSASERRGGFNSYTISHANHIVSSYP